MEEKVIYWFILENMITEWYPWFQKLIRVIIKVDFKILFQNLLNCFKYINGIFFLWGSTKTILYSVSTYSFLWKSSFC